jgi:hypothetical protein
MAMTKEEKRIFERDRKRRETKAAIRAESKAGMYKGGGPGEAQGRKMATIVGEEDKENIEDYGGVDLPTNAKGGSIKKMAYGGKAMKMADGKMVKKKKKTTKVVRRRGDGCAVRGKTKGRMV